MDVFQQYEADFRELTESLESRTTDLANLRGDEAQAEVRALQADITEAEDILKAMRMSARNVTSGSDAHERLRQHERMLQSARDRLRDSARDAEHRELVGGRTGSAADLLGRDGGTDMSAQARGRADRVTTSYEQQTETLRNARRQLDESFQLGRETFTETKRQRSVLEGAQERLRGVNSNIDVAMRKMGEMIRRAYKNKALLFVTILILASLICFVLYFKYFRGHGGGGGGDSSSDGGDGGGDAGRKRGDVDETAGLTLVLRHAVRAVRQAGGGM